MGRKENQYRLKNIGKFPNISAIAFVDNQLYLASRTKSRIAIVDYSTLGLIAEFTTVSKPVAMQIHNNVLYVLGAQNNKLQRINIDSSKVIDTIDIGTEGFSTGFKKIDGTDLAIIIDVKQNKYTVVDLVKGKVIRTYAMTVPINDIIIADKVKLFD